MEEFFDQYVDMKSIDHVAERVTLGAVMGFCGGAAYGSLVGYPMKSTALKVAGSCAMVGTGLFGVERIGYLAFQPHIDNERRLLLTSHAFSGVFGGGLNGYLFHKKPLRGMFFFVPIMMGVAFLEMAWTQKKKERLEAYMAEDQETK